MEFEDRQRFAASRKQLLGAICDPAFLQRKLALQGAWGIEFLAHETGGGRSLLKCRYHRPADARIPAFARKFVAERVEVTQCEEWNLKSGAGVLHVEVRNLPLRIGARMRLQPDDGGCANVLSWSLHCPIPLIGGKLEKLAADEMRVKFAQDSEVARRLLAERARCST
ncbi:MAG: DUF2505 domain-containing protein [Nevskia sp.]|nr:DUF2505 domain-containing protein [Nevskia sp.]